MSRRPNERYSPLCLSFATYLSPLMVTHLKPEVLFLRTCVRPSAAAAANDSAASFECYGGGCGCGCSGGDRAAAGAVVPTAGATASAVSSADGWSRSHRAMHSAASSGVLEEPKR